MLVCHASLPTYFDSAPWHRQYILIRTVFLEAEEPISDRVSSFSYSFET